MTVCMPLALQLASENICRSPPEPEDRRILFLPLVAPLDADDHHIDMGYLIPVGIHCAFRFRSGWGSGLGKPATVREDPALSSPVFSDLST